MNPKLKTPTAIAIAKKWILVLAGEKKLGFSIAFSL